MVGWLDQVEPAAGKRLKRRSEAATEPAAGERECTCQCVAVPLVSATMPNLVNHPRRGALYGTELVLLTTEGPDLRVR